MATTHILIVALLFGYCAADIISYNDCGSSYQLEEVDIHGCKQIPCPIILGRSFNITLRFYPKVHTTSLNQRVFIKVFGLILEEVSATPTNPCTAMPCPAPGSDIVHYTASVYPDPALPPVAGQLTWFLTNQSGERVICMETDLLLYEIVPGKEGYSQLPVDHN